MSARWIGAEVFADGIREFAARVAAEVTQPDELMYLLNFPDSGYDVLIGIEGFGMIMSWAVCCGDAPRSEDAPALIQQNWGGVEGSCFTSRFIWKTKVHRFFWRRGSSSILIRPQKTLQESLAPGTSNSRKRS